MNVFMCPVSQKSLYVRLLLHSLGERYTPIFNEQVKLPGAIESLERGQQVLLHVQWEEFFFNKIKAAEEAQARLLQVASQLRRFHDLGGRILLTLHNELPHASPRIEEFLAVRRLTAALASRILVHNDAAADLLFAQTGISPHDPRVVMLPHPSYAGMYEAEDITRGALQPPYRLPEQRFILGFGTVRAQKGFDGMLEALNSRFTRRHGARITIAGGGAPGVALQRQFSRRDDVTWDLNHVPQDRVPSLIRSASCLVLPYKRVLTSGIALLALTLGGIIVAPAVRTFLELLPASLRRYLYIPGDAADIRRAVSEVLQLTAEESLQRRLEGAAHVAELHPAIISRRLGMIYDELARLSPLALPADLPNAGTAE